MIKWYIQYCQYFGRVDMKADVISSMHFKGSFLSTARKKIVKKLHKLLRSLGKVSLKYKFLSNCSVHAVQYSKFHSKTQ